MDTGVRSLIESEKESQTIIQEAIDQKYEFLFQISQLLIPFRSKRLALAEVDAQEELQLKEKHLTREFEVEEARRKSHNDVLISQNSLIDSEIEEIRKNFALHKDAVVEMLLQQILVVNIEVPKVVQQRFE